MDEEKRLAFTKRFATHLGGYSGYLPNIFLNGCMFEINVVVNKRNIKIWGRGHLMKQNPTDLDSRIVTMWYA